MKQNTPTVKVGSNTITPTNDGVYVINSTSFIVQNGINASSGNQVQINSISITYDGGSTPPSTDPTITFSGQGANLGIKGVGEEFTTSFTVSQQDLEDDITLTLEGPGSLSTDLIEQGDDPTEVTWTYTPTSAGNINATITATSDGAEPVTFTITGVAKAYHNVNIATGIQHGSVTASPTSAYESQYVTLTVTPAQGYELDELTVVDANNSPVTVNANNVFQMPDSYVTVSATFVEAAPTTIVTDELTNANTIGETTNNYTSWTTTGTSGTEYSGQSAGGSSTTGACIQLRSNNNNSGIVSTTSVGKVKKVTVTWNSNTADGRTLNVYGSNTAYEAPTDLYGSSTQGTLLGTIVKGTGNSTELTISGNYTYVGLRSASGAMYLDEIDIDWETTGTPTCAVPTFNPAAGTYTETQSVTISSATEGATIYYTVDGSTPSATNGTQYTAAIEVITNKTIKAIAVKEGYNDSQVAEATYTIIPPAVATPTFSPAAGVYTEAQTVSIVCTTGNATIYYTLDGTDPTTSSSVYSEALSISQTTTVKAMAVKSGMTNSEIATAEYTITPISNISEITEAGNYIVRGTVVAKSTRGFVLGDGTGYIYYYKGNAVDQNVGDIVKISGQVSAPTNYKVFQYTNTAIITTAETSNYQAENPIVLTGSQMDAVVASTNTTVTLSNYVQYEGTLSVNNNYYNITSIDGATTAKGSISYPTNTDFASLNGKTVKVIGYYVGVSSNQYYNTMIGSIEEVTTTDPTLTANPNSLSFTYAEGATEVPTKSFTLTGSNLSDDAITISLPENSNFEMQGPSKSYGRILYLTPIEGAINQEITVRLKENLDVNNYEDEITIDWQGDDFSVTLTGTVTAPEAPHVTWDLSIASYDEVTDPDLVTWSSSYATMTNATGTGSTAASNYLGGDSNNRTSTRFYANNVLTITPASGYSITSVVFEATTDGYASALANSTWNNATANAATKTVTVTPTNGANPISATIGGTCGFTSVTVYYQAVAVAPVWSELPTPAINKNESYSIDLNDYVTGSPAPAITLSTSVSSGLYEYENGLLEFESDTDGSYVFIFTATNSAGSENATLTITVATVHTIEFYVNNENASTLTMTVIDGNALGDLPVPSENIPAGFNFVGWMEMPNYAYYNATTAPTMVSSATEPADDMILEAVFCIGETAPGTWELSSSAPIAGEDVILAAKYDDETYFALFADGGGLTETEIIVSNGVINGTIPNSWAVEQGSYLKDEVTYEGLALYSGQETNNGKLYLHLNTAGGKIATSLQNGIFEFNAATTGGYTMYSKVNGKYLAFDMLSQFHVSSSSDEACPLYVFRYTPGATTNKDYTTLVVNHPDEDTIAASADETFYGIHYINGHVLADNDVTNSGKLVVNNGGKLDMYGNALTNSTADNFVIEDGGAAYLSNHPYGTVKKNITGYGTGTGNWYMLTHPIFVANLAPSDCGMITDDNTTAVRTYDLYSWDPTDTKEWQNYRKNTTMVMTPQAAYLYANVNDVTLTFVGQLRDNQEDVDMDFTLYYNESSDPEARGWNLKGNPTVGNAAISTAFYKLNSTSEGLNTTAYPANSVVGPMEGFFMKATENNQPFTVTPTTDAVTSLNSKSINMDVISNNEMLDRAIVSFNGGMLGKFYLSDNTSRLYFTEGGQDYAIMPSANEGEMPVNFKASKNGTYTISVNAENVEMTYLHLIDNMTGADVDLLATPSYTFEANTTDYASRFRLVFNANNGSNENGNETFAYYNGSEWMINNMGDATLQVVDVMGRVLSSETVSGNATINLNQTPGVYMLRLINGDSVKVQKVVVR